MFLKKMEPKRKQKKNHKFKEFKKYNSNIYRSQSKKFPIFVLIVLIEPGSSYVPPALQSPNLGVNITKTFYCVMKHPELHINV